jgi:hypothetical protein
MIPHNASSSSGLAMACLLARQTHRNGRAILLEAQRSVRMNSRLARWHGSASVAVIGPASALALATAAALGVCVTAGPDAVCCPNPASVHCGAGANKWDCPYVYLEGTYNQTVHTVRKVVPGESGHKETTNSILLTCTRKVPTCGANPGECIYPSTWTVVTCVHTRPDSHSPSCTG